MLVIGSWSHGCLLECGDGPSELMRRPCSPSAGSRASLHRCWEPEQGAGPRGGEDKPQEDSLLEALVFQLDLEEWGACYPTEINRWHRGWGSSTHKVVEAGETGCAWCVVWDKLVDGICREVGGVYLDRQGPQMAHLIQGSSFLFPFHRLKVLGPTCSTSRPPVSPSPVLSHLTLFS